MRVRIRGPSGKSSTATLDDSATIAALRKTIETETSLSSFEIKFGYPPKTLSLDDLPSSMPLSELDVKLNGEQLIVNELKASGQTSATKSTPSDAARNAAQAAGPSRDHGGAALHVPSSSQPSSRTPKPSAAPLSLSRKQNEEMAD